MGVKEMNARYAGGMEYNRQLMRKSKSAMGYRLYMLRYKIKSAAKYMFPNRKTMIELYPRAGQHAALAPALYIYQMFAYPIKKICAGVFKRNIRSESGEINRETQKRLEMFRGLDML